MAPLSTIDTGSAKKTGIGISYKTEKQFGERENVGVNMTPRDRANRGHALFLQRMGSVRAGDIAKEMELSDGQVSEIKNKKVEDAILLLAHVGLKVVDAAFKCVPRNTFDFLAQSHANIVQQAPTLLWGDDD